MQFFIAIFFADVSGQRQDLFIEPRNKGIFNIFASMQQIDTVDQLRNGKDDLMGIGD